MMRYFLLLLGLTGFGRLIGQQISDPIPKLELRIAVGLQRPKLISQYNPADLLVVKDPMRFRPQMALGLRYYPLKHWWVAYQVGWAQQGSSRPYQYTTIQNLQNSLLFGFSARHSRRVVFEAFTGIGGNLLLSAAYHSTGEESIRASSYLRRFTWYLPIGLGLKTQVRPDTYLGIQSQMEFGLRNLSRGTAASAYQLSLPAFNLTLSKKLQ